MRSELAPAPHGKVSLSRAGDATLVVSFAGVWQLERDLPSVATVQAELQSGPRVRRVLFDTTQLVSWDSGLLAFLVKTSEFCTASNVEQVRDGLSTGLRRLLELAEAVPEKKAARRAASTAGLFSQLGDATIGYGLSISEFMAFVGDLSVASVHFLAGKTRYRKVDLLEVIRQCGPDAVGIVSLIAFLVGVILAFMGAVQLAQFGAAIYVADLVAIGMTRDMGAIMTAIIMSGRTGAAFAAKLGTMKVTQEIDALTTMGISPMEFLVLPRVLALVLMMPLLCVFADLMGIAGGMFVGVAMLGLSVRNYLHETISTLTLTNIFGGLFKATAYGSLIAIAGCLRGFQCGNSSSAVGDAATQAVVMSIVMVVLACGVFAVVFNIIGI